MSFLRFQNIKKDEKGRVVTGSASIMKTVYDNTRTHKSHQEVVEKLGKVLWVADDGRSGIFFNSQRGVFLYDSGSGSFSEVYSDDSRITDKPQQEPRKHVVFGSSDLFLNSMKKLGLIAILKKIFPQKQAFQRVLAHLFHTVMKDGSHVHCNDFANKSLLSHAMTEINLDSLESDTMYFSMLGDEKIKIAFFNALVSQMQKTSPNFGTFCLVDSTPLPSDIEDNPFNAFSSHGTGESAKQMRMVLVLDRESGLPVWFSVVSGNILDINTMEKIKNEVLECLNIVIKDYILDAGYCSKELIETFFPPTEDTNDDSTKEEKKFISPGNVTVRMPARKGYPFKLLYHQNKDKFSRGKYLFVADKHTYFGDKTEVKLFGRKVHAYIYVDKQNALTGFSKYLNEHSDEYENMTASEKDWKTVECGFFVLISTYDMTPEAMIKEYFSRIAIESVFKTCKEYLDLLPLSKWSVLTVLGKITSDVISSIIYLQTRKELNSKSESMTSAIGKLESWICMVDSSKKIVIDYPTKGVKKLQKEIKLTTDNNIKLENYFRNFDIDI